MSQRKFDGRRVSLIAVIIVLVLSAMAPSASKAQGNSVYEKTVEPAEAMVVRWDFSGASAVMAKLKFKDKALTDRLAGRRDELKRLTALKTKIIEKANKLKPWLRRGPAVVPGTREIKTVGVQITKASEKTVTVSEITIAGKTSADKPWSKLNDKEISKLLKAAVSDKSADDQLAAGLLALTRSDATAAEGYFNNAKSLGAKTTRYLGPLVAAAFAQVEKLLDKKKFTEAGTALRALGKKYGKTPWAASHKKELTEIRGRITEASTEKLYTQAVKLFKKGKSKHADLKEILQKLAKEYPSSRVLIDDNRKPSFTEMELAAEGRKLITVSQSSKAKYKTIQAAINAAPTKGLVEIQDGATYEEEIIISKEKEGVMLRGKRGFWPVIKGPGKMDTISVRAPGVDIQQVVVAGNVHTNAKSTCLREVILAANGGILADGKDVKLYTCFIAANIGGYHRPIGVLVRNSFLLRKVLTKGNTDLRNVFVGDKVYVQTAKLKSCTLADGIRCESKDLTIFNSIASYVEAKQKGVRIEHCNIFGKGCLLLAKAGKGCISKDPQFRDPKAFDYHLKLDSPCRKKASDGKDMGLRQTPAMLAILKKALELRKKGVIKF
jgi:hypothetical protein